MRRGCRVPHPYRALAARIGWGNSDAVCQPLCAKALGLWVGHDFSRADKALAEAGPSTDLYKTCGTQKCPPFHHNQNFGYVASSRVANYVVSIMLRCFLFRAESCCCAFAIVVALCGASSAQNNAPPPQSSSDSGTSLANVVRNSKAHKASHAKKVIGDDDLESSAGPLPKLTMDGAENADDVVAAIKAYKEIHTPAETEDAVRRWYEKYDQELAAAIQENLDIRALREANVNNGYEMCQQNQDYEQCTARQRAEARGARSDQAEINRNNNLTVRIQHAFMKVRNGLTMNNLRYDWFKIRTTNNIDRY